jgi:hypothetical protein
MKNLTLVTLFSFFSFSLFAQKDNSPISIKNFLQDVIKAASDDYASIRGEQVSGEPGTIQFLSTISAPGSLENKVIGYTGRKKTDWVWESRLRAYETIENLQTQYKKLYNDIRGGSIKSSAKTYEAVSEYEQPSEEQRIWTNQFKVVNTKIMIDLVAEQVNYEWVIWLRIYHLDNMAGGSSN